ncbi:MAG: PBP1A family penicillin-binding protein [Psychromonas sp.]|nr:PBP1A family penicillin-binding protein [Psychromonas sp.]
MLKCFKRIFFAFVAMGLLGLISLAVIYFSIKSSLPSVAAIKETKLQVPLKIYSVNGELISQYGEKRRIPLTIDEVPKHLKEAFIATEDRRFYSHIGIDPIGIVRAALIVITSGHARQGASTITQQVARNLYLTRQKTIIRKIREIFLALQIEKILTKNEILMLYLNKIALGQRSFGIGAAAQVYYGKTVSQLTLAQMAVLAGLPKAPSRNNPVYSHENARNRRHLVLIRMIDEGYITKSEFETADNAPITGKLHGANVTLSAPYVAQYALQSPAIKASLMKITAHEKSQCQTRDTGKDIDDCIEKVNNMTMQDRLFTEGLTIYTTVNYKSQKAANKAVIENMLAYDQRHGFRTSRTAFWTSPKKEWDAKKIANELKKYSYLSGLIPAVVVKVKDKSVDIIAKDGNNQIQTINWDGLKWARKFINDTRQGLALRSATQILKAGQLIWIQRVNKPRVKGKEAVVDQNVNQPKMIQLSQVPEVGSAFVSISPVDGAITSLVGGFNFGQSPFDRATQAKRQVGSNIKPFVYSAALDNGYTLATLVNDTPINQWDGDSEWRPKNSPPIYEGPIRLRKALGESKNVVSVRLVENLGVPTVVDRLVKFGFNRNDIPQSKSIALGSPSFTPLEVAVGYAVISNGGYKIDPYIIERIEDINGNVIYQASPKTVCKDCEALFNKKEITMGNSGEGPYSQYCQISPIPEDRIAQSAISEDTSFLVRELLRTAIWGGGVWKDHTGWNGTGWRAAKAIKRPDMGGKTGTTNDSKDAWFSGYVGNVVATTWVGFDNFDRKLGYASRNKNIGTDQIFGAEFGGRTAIPAWDSFMLASAMDQPILPAKRPRTISTARIDRATGLLTKRTDNTTLFEYFKAGTLPTTYANHPDLNYNNYGQDDDKKNQKQPESGDDLF